MGETLPRQSEVNMKGIAPTIRAEHHGNILKRNSMIISTENSVTESVFESLIALTTQTLQETSMSKT